MLTVQEAAERLNVTVKAIYYALNEGLLTRHEQYGRILLDEAEVTAYQPRAHGERPSKRSGSRKKQETAG